MEEARHSALNPLSAETPMGQIYSRGYERFTRLQRRIDSTDRSYYRALTQLQRLRREVDYDNGPGSQPEPEPAPPDPDASSAPVPPAPVPELASFCPSPTAKAVIPPTSPFPLDVFPYFHYHGNMEGGPIPRRQCAG